jgi:hypothetical protein
MSPSDGDGTLTKERAMGIKKDVLRIVVKRLRDAGHDLIHHEGTDKARVAGTVAARLMLRVIDNDTRATYNLAVVVKETPDRDLIVKMVAVEELTEGLYGNWLPTRSTPIDTEDEPFRPSPSPDE